MVFLVDIKRKSTAYTALELAALGGHEGVARLLLSQPSPRGYRSANNHIRLVTLAAMSGNLSVLKLLDREADHSYSPIWKDIYCHSLLAAAYSGETEVIFYLLQKGAKLKYSESLQGEDTTALGLAALRGQNGIKLSLERGAKIDGYPDHKGMSLSLAVKSYGIPRTVGLLLENNAFIRPGLLEDAARESPVCVIRILEKGVHKGLGDGGDSFEDCGE